MTARLTTLLLGLAMAATSVSADSSPAVLRVGDPLPALEGEFLTERPAILPQASAGKVALLAIGFTYASRVPVEAWSNWYRKTVGGKGDATFFEVPIIGGMAKMGRWFIDRGMRKGTPAELHEHVITVYHGAGDWKTRLAYAAEGHDHAYLVVLDQGGVVRWLHHGPFDEARAHELQGVVDALLTTSP